jgi:hypothetical protein
MTASAVLRSRAMRRKPHGTSSAYREAVVTNSHRSAAASSCAASSRLAVTTESMSGASSSAKPGGRLPAVAIFSVPGSPRPPPVTLASPGRIVVEVNHAESAGLATSVGASVVGRSTPGSVTVAPTSELTRVDFPAPVEPPTTASSGASIAASLGSR